MLTTFLGTINPVLMLFLFMAIGFVTKKTKILPDNANKTLAKLETWVLCPALSFMSMARTFTTDTLSTHLVNITFASITVAISLAIAIPLSALFIKKPVYERGVYQYALAFANLGYMADPLVLAMFGEEVLGYYKLFCLPFTIVIYIWGISVLTPKDKAGVNPITRLLNAPIIAMLLGMLVGISGILPYFPTFITNTLDQLKACMGPLAMLLAGITIANYSFKKLWLNKRVYIATLLRLIVLPTLLVSILIGVRALLNTAFSMGLGNDFIYFAFFATAMPLGMNTIVFPEAYGGDPEPGASMAIISSLFSILTIPLLYSLLTLILPDIPFPMI